MSQVFANTKMLPPSSTVFSRTLMVKKKKSKESQLDKFSVYALTNKPINFTIIFLWKKKKRFLFK